ncbi:U1 small nuclear ribonucleoprotein 70 kDa-like [Planococcus citri]|uniref:U1 small nuclear ribonucleoprotein 70 kDa-like n=1 Tax=Planococcus citri TaxID=170843 RepID=UPI0031F7A30E
MTQYLPPNLLALFNPRDPIRYLPPINKLPYEKKNRGYVGVFEFIKYFEDPKDTPPPVKVETREERKERRKKERAEQVAYKLEQEIALWNPHNLRDATTDAFKTLFVARINYDTSESKLRREFEVYGPIRKIVLALDENTGKPKGYAFIEYEHERDMHTAYKHADGKKIDGKRVLVDVERGRTVKGWLPRRLGGGLGGTRRGGADVNLKHSGREDNERERERYRLEREESTPTVRERRRPAGDADRDRRRAHRSRSREREKRRRSRSRSREHRRRDDSERDRKRSKRSRSRERDRRDKENRDRKDRDRDSKKGIIDSKEKIRVKTEPPDDYPDYSNYSYNYQGTNVKEEKDEKKEKGGGGNSENWT